MRRLPIGNNSLSVPAIVPSVSTYQTRLAPLAAGPRIAVACGESFDAQIKINSGLGQSISKAVCEGTPVPQDPNDGPASAPRERTRSAAAPLPRNARK